MAHHVGVLQVRCLAPGVRSCGVLLNYMLALLHQGSQTLLQQPGRPIQTRNRDVFQLKFAANAKTGLLVACADWPLQPQHNCLLNHLCKSVHAQLLCTVLSGLQLPAASRQAQPIMQRCTGQLQACHGSKSHRADGLTVLVCNICELVVAVFHVQEPFHGDMAQLRGLHPQAQAGLH